MSTTELSTLAGLAQRINDHHAKAEASAQQAIEHALAAGRLLIEAKGQVKHGEWLPWLKANCEIKPRQAQKYMQLVERWPEIQAKAHSDAHLTIDRAVGLLNHKPEAEPTARPSAYQIAFAANLQDIFEAACLGTILNFGAEYLHLAGRRPTKRQRRDSDELRDLSWFLGLERFDMAVFVWSVHSRGDYWNKFRECCSFYGFDLSALAIVKTVAPHAKKTLTAEDREWIAEHDPLVAIMPFVNALESDDYRTASGLSDEYMHEHSVIGPWLQEHPADPAEVERLVSEILEIAG